MKWLPKTGSKNRKVAVNQNFRSTFLSLSQLMILTSCLIFAGIFLAVNGSKFRSKLFASSSTQKSSAEIDAIALNISVKILNESFLGSGFIVLLERDKYTVITNQHVLRAGQAPYSIQTADGKVHLATVAPKLQAVAQKYDLAVLEFTADDKYDTAQIGNSLELEVGQPIYAAGFPNMDYQSQEPALDISEQNKANVVNDFDLKVGRVAMILNQALKEGYQIAYTNDVRKGMSGGPLLNYQGEVVGVNGKHAYPLWESAELYQDGSQPCPALQKLITRSSLAIPIEKTTELASQLKSIKQQIDVRENFKSDWSDRNSKLVAKMQAEAEATNQSCEKQ